MGCKKDFYIGLNLLYHQCIYLSSPCVLISEPSFVFADVIRAEKHRGDGEDDKVYYFFTEVSVEYEFFGKLLIPRVARVCKVSRRCCPSAPTCSMLLLSSFPCCCCLWIVLRLQSSVCFLIFYSNLK